jgi:hypothetical protein
MDRKTESLLRSRWFTLDGRILPDAPEFVRMNAFTAEEIQRIASMPVGASMDIGSGAFATFTLRRTR